MCTLQAHIKQLNNSCIRCLLTKVATDLTIKKISLDCVSSFACVIKVSNRLHIIVISVTIPITFIKCTI